MLDHDGAPARCISKAREGEPLFILRANDRLAPMLVQIWADLAAAHGCPSDKVDGARDVAHAMADWGEKNGCKWPD